MVFRGEMGGVLRDYTHRENNGDTGEPFQLRLVGVARIEIVTSTQ